MSVSRNVRGEDAVMVLSLDGAPPPAALARLRELDGIGQVRFVSLDPPPAGLVGPVSGQEDVGLARQAIGG
jgi:hypothetical protein